MVGYAWSHIHKLFGFWYSSLQIIIGKSALNVYAYLYPYWQGFEKLDIHIQSQKLLQIANMTLCYIMTHVRKLRFRCSRDARYSFHWEKWVSELCNFVVCHCRAFHFQHLHIIVFIQVWCIVHLFLYLCFWFFGFQLYCCCLKVLVSISYLSSSSVKLQNFQLYC